MFYFEHRVFVWHTICFYCWITKMDNNNYGLAKENLKNIQLNK